MPRLRVATLALIQATMARRLPTICQKAFCRSRPFASNTETEIVYAWNERGFAGDSVMALQCHVADHLSTGTPLQNCATD